METGVEFTAQPGTMRHRALDGLRGLAVAAVVLYHFAPGIMPGGFLGVDVFFVLSGFLITSLMLTEVSGDGSISLRGFWSRRVRRLLPASLALIAVTVALAWWLEPSSARPALRTQALASLFYVNNWSAITSGSSYEGRFGRELPLTHFWSLAIEEQFYLLFPIAVGAALLVLRRRNRISPTALARPLLLGAALGALGSAVLMAMMYRPHLDPSRLYFGSDTRLHAILVGVALACLHRLRPPPVQRARPRLSALMAASMLIVLLVAFTFAGFRQDWLYRGGFLTISMVTGLLIWLVVRGPAPSLRFPLHHRWLVGLGLVSYGVYLWHWPARVFLTTDRTGLDGVSLFAARVVVTAVATAISLVLVERPFRQRRSAEARRGHLSMRQSMFAGAAVIGVALMCVVLTMDRTAPGSQPVAAPPIVEPSIDEPIRVYLVGDSVAWTLAGGEFAIPQPSTARSSFDPQEVSLWNRSRFGLSLLRWPKRTETTETEDCPTCEPVIDWTGDIERFRPDLVVHSTALYDSYDLRIGGEWVEFGSDRYDTLLLEALESLRLRIRDTGTRLVLMAQPTPGNYPAEWSRQYARDSRTFPHINELLRRFAAANPDVGLIDLEAILCPDRRCILQDGSGRSLRSDGLHFTDAGAAFLAPILTEQFHSLLRPTSSPPADGTRSAG